ncbi:hypothetical protein QQ045_030291 [Rhodiola kirilowii]
MAAAAAHQQQYIIFSSICYSFLVLVIFSSSFLSIVQPSAAALVKEQPLVLKYHNGALLKGNITLNLIWYGTFTPAQRSIIIDFIHSLSTNPNSGHHRNHPNTATPSPSVASWWRTTSKYKNSRLVGGSESNLILGRQLLLNKYSLGKSLKETHLRALSSKTMNTLRSINVVLTSSDVSVDRFCMSRCASHGSTTFTKSKNPKEAAAAAYVWVGNPETQCPGQCAWPFHQPIYGPQTPPLISPNNDVGVDGMIINLATVLAGTVTNPFRNGYFQGPQTAPLEAVSACTGAFGKGAYPGYPGEVLVDKVTGASYNAHGMNGRKYLLPAMWDPQTSACRTLV